MTKLTLSNKEIDNYFAKKIENIDIELEETRAYIHKLLKSFINPTIDYSKSSITLVFSDAKNKYSFDKFQKLADWMFITRTLYPESLKMSEDFYDNLAQHSYYKCYIIINKSWPCFEELSDKFSYFVNNINFSHKNNDNIFYYQD